MNRSVVIQKLETKAKRKIVISDIHGNLDLYLKLLDQTVVRILLHAIIVINSYFLLNGEKYYNENVGAE